MGVGALLATVVKLFKRLMDRSQVIDLEDFDVDEFTGEGTHLPKKYIKSLCVSLESARCALGLMEGPVYHVHIPRPACSVRFPHGHLRRGRAD